ncbi:MAG: IclR family transcriptional regulator [Meiothermus silvanus]|nr:IclR family transcriptional regulator [Allomeiothermus silvanus]
MSTPTSPDKTQVRAVRSALLLLEILSQLEGAPLTVLARQAGLSNNQTFRLLATLEPFGYVVRDARKGYRLGPKLHLLGEKAFWPHDLIRAAAPHLDRLAEMSGELVLLAVRVGLERMVVDRRPSRYSLRVDWAVGSRLPLHVGGLGVALLAFSPPEVQEAVLSGPLERFTPYTLATPKALKAELERVRQQGVRVSVDDWAMGEFSIAAPVVAGGTLRGALNIAGFTARLDEQRRKTYIAAVREAAKAIAAELAGHLSTTPGTPADGDRSGPGQAATRATGQL